MKLFRWNHKNILNIFEYLEILPNSIELQQYLNTFKYSFSNCDKSADTFENIFRDLFKLLHYILINLSNTISNSVIYHLTSSYCVQSDNYSRAINLVFPSKKYSLARVTLENFTFERNSKNDKKGY